MNQIERQNYQKGLRIKNSKIGVTQRRLTGRLFITPSDQRTGNCYYQVPDQVNKNNTYFNLKKRAQL